MTRIALLLVATTALVPFAASAYPDGAPWTAHNNPGGACASCHFGGSLVEDSEALVLNGVETPFTPGKTYSLALRFGPETAEAVGFLAVFNRPDGETGSLAAGEDLEARGAVVRSISVRSLRDRKEAVWAFDWTAPNTPGPVTLRIAANAGNDDASPLGDVIHLKEFLLEVARKGDRRSDRRSV